jgi:hypothetical protein
VLVLICPPSKKVGQKSERSRIKVRRSALGHGNKFAINPKEQSMSHENAALIQKLYTAFASGDVDAVLGHMSPEIIWNEAENNPYADGNPYVGPAAVAPGVFSRLRLLTNFTLEVFKSY